MTYEIIQPPFEKSLRDMSKAELRQYFQWFIEAIPRRVAVLEESVRATDGFEDWSADFTPESLGKLGHWFATQVGTRSLTPAELDSLREKQSFPIDVPEEELTHKTFSLAMDIGMYLGEVFLSSHSSLKWDQQTSDKKFAYYGQPLIVGFGAVPFNPCSTVVVIARGLVAKEKNGDRLREIYEIWLKRIAPV